MLSRLTSLVMMVAAFSACSDSMTAPVEADPQFAQSSSAAAAKPSNSSIVDLAVATPDLSTLVFAITTSDANCGTDFAGLFSGRRGQFTVFAPTNAAFDAAIAALGADTVLSCDVLPTVLAFHAAPGRHTSTSVLAHKRFRMLSKEWAEVSGATIAGAPLNLALIDISASNGIVHVVDAVLLPPSITG